jgi:hypothetical protein
MLKTFFIDPSWFGSELTNQLFCIVYGIIHCINNNKKSLVINNFKLEPNTQKNCQISNILNIHYLNILLQKYKQFQLIQK